jgi:hypothetical protein
MKCGTILVVEGERDPGTLTRVLFYIEHAIQDANLTCSSARRVISKQMLYVEIDGQQSFGKIHLSNLACLGLCIPYNYRQMVPLFMVKFLPSRRGGFSTHFHCMACGHTFRRSLKRIYIDGPTLDRRKALDMKVEGRSEIIIPQHISCPNCQVVDQ